MDKSLSRILFLSGLGLIFLAILVILVDGDRRSIITIPSADFTKTYSLDRGSLFFICAFLLVCILWLISFVGALVKLAQLGRWGWFVFLFCFGYIPLLFYIFFGPRTHPPSFDYVAHGYHWESTSTLTPWGGQGRWVK